MNNPPAPWRPGTELVDLSRRMRLAIAEHTARRGNPPAFIYLGAKEAHLFEVMVEIFNHTPRYETGLSRDRRFMDVKVIFVAEEGSHLAVADLPYQPSPES